VNEESLNQYHPQFSVQENYNMSRTLLSACYHRSYREVSTHDHAWHARRTEIVTRTSCM